MHKLIEYVCDELDELERKVDKGGKLSASEMQYLDTLAHTKKNLLKAEEMSEDMEYSGAMIGRRVYNDGMSYNMDGSYARDGRRVSYARRRRDSMGRYSRDDDFKGMLEDAMEEAPNESIRQQLRSMLQMM